MSEETQHEGDVLDAESTEREFNRFVDMMGLDLELDHMDEDEVKAFNKQKRKITKYIQKGYLVINDNGEPTFVKFPRSPKIGASEIVFHEPGGASFMETDGKTDVQNVRKMHAIMGEMTKRPPSMFINVMGADYKVMQALVLLFLD